MRLPIAIAAGAVALLAVGCTASAARPAASQAPPDPHTAVALLRIATVFNREYDGGNYGPAYTRWDARSQG